MEDEDYKAPEFFAGKKILIIDASKSFAQMISKTLAQMAIEPGSVKIASTESMAIACFELRPQIIISEYQVGHTSGFTYASIQKEYLPHQGDRTFLLVTANADESSIVEAMEEDVDGYLLKPFSAVDFKAVMKKVINIKENPTKYMKAIEVVRQLISQNQFAKAEDLALAAISASPTPSLAHSYLATCYIEEERYQEALEQCDKGLAFKDSHYRCLRMKIDALIAMQENKKALETVTHFLDTFPPSSGLLSRAFDLTRVTRDFTTMDDLYEEFKKKEARSKELVEAACEAFLEGGRKCYEFSENKRAFEMLSRCAVSSGRNEKYIEKIVLVCLENKNKEDAEKFFKKYPAEKVGLAHHAQVDYMISKYTLEPPQIIEKGRQLIARGNAPHDIYEDVIKQMFNIGLQMAGENLAYEAAKKYPDLRADFMKLIEEAGKD